MQPHLPQYHKKLYRLERRQEIHASLPQVWDFISSPHNLSRITPAYMRFEVLTPDLPEKMHEGLRIQYYVRPLLGIKMKWVTVIPVIREPEYFVDNQEKGPYAYWHHYHHLQPTATGVIMTDIVHYRPPMGLLGKLAHALFIKRQLNAIFDYRFKKMEEIFPARGH